MTEREIFENQYEAAYASFTQRFFSTFFDVLLFLLINIPCFWGISYYLNKINTSPSLIKDIVLSPSAGTVIAIYIFLFLFFGLCIMPIIFTSQTPFSKFFGVRAVFIKKVKSKPFAFFKSYFPSVFLPLIYSIIAFSTLWIFTKPENPYAKAEIKNAHHLFQPIRVLITAVVFIQINYFIFAISSKPFNPYLRNIGIIYVDINKEKKFVVDLSKDAPKQIKLKDMKMFEDLEKEEKKKQKLKEEEEKKAIKEKEILDKNIQEIKNDAPEIKEEEINVDDNSKNNEENASKEKEIVDNLKEESQTNDEEEKNYSLPGSLEK